MSSRASSKSSSGSHGRESASQLIQASDAARPQDPAGFAQGAEPVRDQLEDERGDGDVE